MELLNPSIGIIFWTLLSFIIVVFLLSKFAWKPIIKGLRSREEYIANSISNAKAVEEKVKRIHEESEKLLTAAMEERKHMLHEAKQMYDRILAEAEEDAKKETDRMVKSATERIFHEQQKAMDTLKRDLVEIIMEVSGKVLEEKLKQDAESKKLVEKLIKQVV